MIKSATTLYVQKLVMIEYNESLLIGKLKIKNSVKILLKIDSSGLKISSNVLKMGCART